MTHDRPLHLVFVADERFAMPLGVSVASCLAALASRPPVELYLLDGGMRPASRRRLHRVIRRSTPEGVRVNVHWAEVPPAWLPDLTNYVFRNTNFNATVFYRYAIPRLVPADCDRAVYLDSDVVVRGDVVELQRAVRNEDSVAAVRDFSIPTYRHRFSGRTPDALSPYDPALPYFNSGVLGINVAYWREHGVHEAACRMLSDHPDTCRWPGQDPLNFTLRGTWREVDLGWNLQTGGPDRIRRLGGSEADHLGEPYSGIRGRARIIHFTGNKPWRQGFTNPDRPAWVEALKASGWYGPVGFRRWQAGWWGNLLRRQAGKKLEHVLRRHRSRLSDQRPGGDRASTGQAAAERSS